MNKFCLLFVFTVFAFTNLFALDRSVTSAKPIDYIKISQDFLYAAKTGDTTSKYIDTLSKANEDVLAKQLNNDNKRLAFWLNIYNGFTQVILKKDPDQYTTRNSFFSSRQIEIAGRQLSLDDIEHGILRHSKVKWSEGYLGKLFPSSFEKKFRVEKLDYRIHFALNCGAKSCPPIAFYEPASIDKQLMVAVRTYLKGECEYDSAKNVVNVPALMGWFRHDFGGKKNMLEILKQNKIIPQDRKPDIHFKKYDWSLYLNNYKSENNG
ncbi:DUF547 domain-containing protein [Mucilaginibacter terrae]|uniref:DUF547 domain-containing protein n=1 Tax=Mucilaginibacter terrae TaxID=1955052 RepID=UPI003629B0F3